MSRRKQTHTSRGQSAKQKRVRNDSLFRQLIEWFLPPGELFDQKEFHGDVRWLAEKVCAQALIWSWQDAKNVTDAFEHTQEICKGLKLSRTIMTYTAFMNALARYADVFQEQLRNRFQMLAERNRSRGELRVFGLGRAKLLLSRGPPIRIGSAGASPSRCFAVSVSKP